MDESPVTYDWNERLSYLSFHLGSTQQKVSELPMSLLRSVIVHKHSRHLKNDFDTRLEKRDHPDSPPQSLRILSTKKNENKKSWTATKTHFNCSTKSSQIVVG